MNKLWNKILDWINPTRRSRRAWKWIARWDRAVTNCRNILCKGEPSEARFRRWDKHAKRLVAIIDERNRNYEKYF